MTRAADVARPPDRERRPLETRRTSLFFRDLDEHLIEVIAPALWSFY